MPGDLSPVRHPRTVGRVARRLHRHRRRCEAFARLICADRRQASGAVTRAYAAVLSEGDSVTLPTAQLRARLATHIRRYGLELRRSGPRRRSSVGPSWEELPVDPDAPAFAVALRALPPSERRILVAIYLGGHTVSEVAESIGLERSRVLSELANAVATLRAKPIRIG